MIMRKKLIINRSQAQHSFPTVHLLLNKKKEEKEKMRKRCYFCNLCYFLAGKAP